MLNKRRSWCRGQLRRRFGRITGILVAECPIEDEAEWSIESEAD